MPSNADQAPAADTASARGPINVPWIVLAMAALPVVVAVLFAVVGGLIVAIAYNEPFDTAGFPAILGLLSGQSVRIAAGADVFDAAGSGTVGLRILPLGFVTFAAAALTRIGFTRAWLGIRSVWPPLAGVAATAVVAFVALVTASFTSVDVGFASAGLQVRFSLVGLLIIGAGPWLLAQLVVRWPVLRNLLWGFIGLQLITAAYTTISIATEGFATGGDQAAAITLVFLGSLAWSFNALVALLWWPFFGALGIGGSAGAVVGMTGESTSFGFLDAAEQNGWLWLVPVVATAGIVAALWFQPVRTSWSEVRQDLLRLAASLTVLTLPALWVGRVLIRGRGELALEALADLPIFWDMGLPSGSGEVKLNATFGATGMPLRFVPALLIWCLIAAITAVVAAQRAGAGWASAESLSAEARTAGGSLATRARAAAETARRAAEAAQQSAQQAAASAPGTAAPPVSQDTPTPPMAPAATEAVDAGTPAFPPAQDPSTPEPPAGTAPSPAPAVDVPAPTTSWRDAPPPAASPEPAPETKPSWRDAPPPVPETKRPE